MANVNYSVCVVVLSLCFIAVFADISLGEGFKNITEECKKRCERTYPLHTYPKKQLNVACLRGCRLSAIGQLSSPHRDKENTSKICIAGCKAAYPDKDGQFACTVGCNEQGVIPTAETLFKEHSVGVWSVHGYTRLQPVMVAQQYCNGFYRRVTYYISISTAYFTSTNNGHTVVIKVNSPPQFLTRFTQQQEGVKEVSHLKVHIEKRQQDVHGFTWKAVHKSKAWLHCVSQRSGLPFWLLSTFLFMGFAFMLWLCCSSISTVPKSEKEKHLLVDDVFFLDGDELLKKQPLLRSDEAGPLPLKVHIAATTI